MKDTETKHFKSMDQMFEEIKRMRAQIDEIKKEIPGDIIRTEACLIMVMKIECAFLLINKMFSAGMFDNTYRQDLGVDKTDITGNAGNPKNKDK